MITDFTVGISIPIKIIYVSLKWVFNFGYKLFLKEPYVIDELSKHVRIHADGHGLITTTMQIRVLKPEVFKQKEYVLNIEDGCKTAFFASWATLKKTKQVNRFTNLGVWWECDKNVITNVTAKRGTASKKSKNLVMRFIIDVGKVKLLKRKVFTIKYALAVPKMWPIKNGKFDKAQAPNIPYKFESRLEFKSRVKLVRYLVSIDKDIKLKQNPILRFTRLGQKSEHTKTLATVDKSDIFYTRYLRYVKFPKLKSKINFQWYVEE